MLPFPRRKAVGECEEVELGEDDFVHVVNDSTPAVHARNADLAATVRKPRHSLPPGSRRVLAEDVEEDVAGQCLASIAAETSRDISLSPASSSQIRALVARPASSPPPPPRAFSVLRLPSLPAVSPPPLLRPSTFPLALAPRGFALAPGVRDSSPPPAFVRRSSARIPVAAVSSRQLESEHATTASSVAPVSMPGRSDGASKTAEPTVIVLRERPKLAWMIAAASLGALGALLAARLLTMPVDERSPSAAQAATQLSGPAQVSAPLPPPPSTAVVVPAAPAPASLSTASMESAASAAAEGSAASSAAARATVVRFDDDQGVAIKATPRPAPAAPPPVAPAPRAPGARPGLQQPRPLGPALPDGSFGLSRAESASPASAPAPTSTVLSAALSPLTAEPPPPPPPRKRVLTPEQQLADAQLKASMK